MIGTERQLQILDYIRNHETISVRQVVEKFYVSEATARRDLAALENTGLVRRVFGGATLIIGSERQVPLFVRQQENQREKASLCEKAATYVKDGDVIFVDASSTTQYILPHLKKFKDLVVVTNGITAAHLLGEMNIKVYVTGGMLINNSSVLVGSDAEAFIDKLNADICFISCKGLSADGKLTDTSYEETQIRKRYLKNSKKKIVILTANKIGKTYMHTLCREEDVDVIVTTEKALTETPAGDTDGKKTE